MDKSRKQAKAKKESNSRKPRSVTDSTHNVSSSDSTSNSHNSNSHTNTSSKTGKGATASSSSRHTTSSKHSTASTDTNRPNWHRRLEVTTSAAEERRRLPDTLRPIPIPSELPRNTGGSGGGGGVRNRPPDTRTKHSENPPRQRRRQKQEFEDQSGGGTGHRNRSVTAATSSAGESPETSVCSTISNIDHNKYGLRNPDNKIVFICYLCSKYCATKDDVLDHLRRVHGSSEESVNGMDVKIYSRLQFILPP